MKKMMILFLAALLISLLSVEKVEAENGLVCPTPKSLMLHSAFGSKEMDNLAEVIIEGGYNTLTYEDVYELYDQGLCPPKKSLIVSIDDLSGVWLRYTFRDMIKAFTDRDLVLTVGVVTGDQNDQDPEIWDYFKHLDSLGVEIASHSKSHYDLTSLNQEGIDVELVESYQVICKNLGECPSTFILPFGKGLENPYVIERSKAIYRGVVSISGSTTFGENGNIPFLFKRVPPDNIDQLKTLVILEKSFVWWINSGFKQLPACPWMIYK